MNIWTVLKSLMKNYLIDANIFSSLKDECISEKHYLHAINVWNTLKRKATNNYHDLCLKTRFIISLCF